MKISAKEIFLLGAMISLMSFSGLAYASGDKVVKVSNFSSFLKAVAPDVTIILTNNIDASFGPEELEIARQSKYLTLAAGEDYYKDWEKDWTIKDVNNFKISGQENATQKTKIVTKSGYLAVLKFSNTKNVVLQNLDLSHSEESGLAKVLEVSNSSNIFIKNTDLSGGNSGLRLKNVSDFNFENSTISDCSDRLAVIINSKNVIFSSSSFKNSLMPDDAYGFTFLNSRDVKFNNSLFANLSKPDNSSSIFYLMDEASNLDIKNSKFLNNNSNYFSNKSLQIGRQITEVGNDYQNNTFSTPSKIEDFKEIADKRYDRYYVHKLSGIKFYQAIPLDKQDEKNGEIIPYGSELKFIKQESEEIVRNNIPGRWAYAEFQGRKGYVFDGSVSYFPVKDEKDEKMYSYYKKLTSAGINSSFEREVINGEEIGEKGDIQCCQHPGYKYLMKVQACNEKDVFWLFRSYQNLPDYVSFPNKELVKSLVKNGKISKERPEAIGGKWAYWLEDGVIKAAIENPDKDPSMWSDGLEISFNKDLEITSFNFYLRSEGGGSTVSFAKQGRCAWQMEESAFTD